MSFDDLQTKWQLHNPAVQININVDTLLREVRRNHRALESQLWWRDANEVMAAVLVTLFFVFFSVLLNQWTLLLCGAGSFLVGIFFIVDRVKQRRRCGTIEESLQSTVDASLAQVEHQIALLTSLWKWYLMPLVPGLVLFLVSSSLQSHGGLAEQLVIAAVGLVCVVAFWQVYRVNRREVQRTLVPRRLELMELRANLNPPAN